MSTQANDAVISSGIHPSWFILVVNTIGIAWAFYVWRKNLKQQWMVDLRDTGSSLLGAAARWREFKVIAVPNQSEDVVPPVSTDLRSARADFEASKFKLLMLFTKDSDTYNEFQNCIQSLKNSLEGSPKQNYLDASNELNDLIHERVYKEWRSIKRIFKKKPA